jgi:ABC-type nitrate/sulfonate/bicarbonate transport system substrate-binding protein
VQPLLDGKARSIQIGWSRGLLLVTDKFMSEHPEAVNEFVKAYREAVWDMSQDRATINQAVADVSQQPLNVVQASAEEDRNYREATSLDDVVVRLSDDELNDLQGLGDFLFTQKRLDTKPDIRGALALGPIDQAEKKH